MNRLRRARIKSTVQQIELARDRLELIMDEEVDSMNEYPENLHGTDIYQTMESCVDLLDSSIEKLDDIIDDMSNIP